MELAALVPRVEPGSCQVDLDDRNRRIKLMEYESEDLPRLVPHLKALAEDRDWGKVIVYARKQDVSCLERLGLRLEGRIDGFFNGETAYLMAGFVDEDRAVSKARDVQDEILEMTERVDIITAPRELPDEYELRPADPDDAPELARLFRSVFETYPTPMHEAEEVKKAIEKDVHFSVVTHGDRIVSASSADVFPRYNCAELTDCATYPEYRGNGFVCTLFFDLEDRLRRMGIPRVFSLTRAVSTGMNMVVAKHGYRYRGRLIQNCDIAGRYEDMNIWVKCLDA